MRRRFVKKLTSWAPYVVALLAASLLSMYAYQYLSKRFVYNNEKLICEKEISDELIKRGQLGDALNPLSGLFAGVALLLSMVSLKNQTTESRSQTKQQRLNNELQVKLIISQHMSNLAVIWSSYTKLHIEHHKAEDNAIAQATEKLIADMKPMYELEKRMTLAWIERLSDHEKKKFGDMLSAVIERSLNSD